MSNGFALLAICYLLFPISYLLLLLFVFVFYCLLAVPSIN